MGSIRRLHSIKNQKGFSLVEVLVASFLMLILGLAMVTMTVNQQRQNKALQQKLDVMEVEQTLLRLLAEPQSCQCMFQGLVWNPDGQNNLPDLTTIKNGCATGANNTLLSHNAVITGTSSSLKVNAIKVKNAKDIGGNNRTADIEISFLSAPDMPPVKSILLSSQSFSINPADSKIDQCLGVAGADKMCVSMGGSWSAGKCTLAGPSPEKPQNTTGCEASYGPGWSWNGSTCTPPAVGKPCVEKFPVGLAWNPVTYCKSFHPGTVYANGVCELTTQSGTVQPQGTGVAGFNTTSGCQARQCQDGKFTCAVGGISVANDPGQP